MADGIQGRQHVVTLAAGGSRHEEADQTPEEAEERPLDEVGGIQEQHRPLAPLGLTQPRPQFAAQEIGLLLRVGLGRDGPDLAPSQVESFFKKTRTWVRLRRTPVCCSMTA